MESARSIHAMNSRQKPQLSKRCMNTKKIKRECCRSCETILNTFGIQVSQYSNLFKEVTMETKKTMAITEDHQSKTRKLIRGLFSIIMMPMLISFSLGGAEARRYVLPDISADDFVSVIDNPYMPLEPGTTFVYEAETADEFILNNITVTDETKEIMGVSCTVVYDVEWVNGLLTEETYDWYAQDADGNVWYFGEATIEYLYDDAGILIGTSTEGSWEAGVDGATPGIVMLATPKPGISYRQEFYEGEAEDMGKF